MRTNWYSSLWVEALKNTQRTIVSLDLRGHGHSKKFYTKENYSLDLMAQDLESLRMRLGHKHIAVMGYSMGARLAAHYATCYPHTIRALLICGMSSNLFSSPSVMYQNIYTALLAESDDLITDPEFSQYRTFAVKYGGDLAALAYCSQSIGQQVDLKRFQQLDQPILFIQGEQDPIAGKTSELPKLGDHVKKIELNNLNHANCVGASIFKKKVLQFLDSVD